MKFDATGAIHEKLLADQGRVLPPGYDTIPKEIREEIPPQEDLWTNAPGELVWQYNADPEKESLGMTGFSWQVRKVTDPLRCKVSETGRLTSQIHYEASAPYRAVFYRGDTPENALACLMKGLCHLSREGALNPSNPYRPGSPPIQHAIHILTERLLQMVEHRQDHLFMSGYAENPDHVGAIPLDSISRDTGSAGDDEQSKKAREERAENLERQALHAVSRDNEVIAALATAVSALARVKDL